MTKLLQGIGVIAVIALVAGSLVALSVVNRRIHVTVQDEVEAATRGPDPVELLRADVTQLSTDLGTLTDGVGGQLEALHGALEENARARANAQAAEIAALKKQVQELQARLDRSIQEEAAARARLDQALAGIGTRLDAVAAAGASAAPEPAIEMEPAVEVTSEPEAAPSAGAEPQAAPTSEPAAEQPAKGFLTFKLPSRSFAFDKPQRWSILPALSRVGFDAKSTLHDFSGSTQKVEGELVANLARPEDGCKGKVSVDAASLDSGEAARDEDMRALLGVPGNQLTFEWTGFRTESSDAAAMKTSGTVLGKLTIHGTEREIEMPVRISVDASRRAAVEGEVEIRMSDFGVKPPRKLGVLSVEDTVKIWIALRARSLGEAVGAAGD